MTYQNCGPMSGTSPFDIVLGSNGNGSNNNSQITNKLALGYEHSCGISSAGGVKCWGSGVDGQLGYGGYVAYSISPTIVTVAGSAGLPAPVSKISAGSNFTCALLNTGAVYCWGDDTYGQLGNGVQSTNSANAVAASTETYPVSDIATSAYSTCVVLVSGAVQCWGLGTSGQLGNGSMTNSTSAVSVNGITNAVRISGGTGHFCATLSTGAVQCWGLNTSGQLGNQASTPEDTPVTATVSPSQRTAGGSNDTCAILTGGTVSCWGDNTYGELGNGNTRPTTAIMPVINISGVTDLSLGEYAACALIGGSVKCWGYNIEGELGDGNATSTSTPTPITSITTATAIASGTYHACAFLSSGSVECWGWNGYGQLGVPLSTTSSDNPVAVNGGQPL